jgi:hypothetical protein
VSFRGFGALPKSRAHGDDHAERSDHASRPVSSRSPSATGGGRQEALRDPLYLASALSIAAIAHFWRREPEKTLETARRALQVAREVGFPMWQGRAMLLHHWAATTLEPATAKTHFEELSAMLPDFLAASPYGRTAFTPCIVEVYAAAGETDRALGELDDALAFVEASDERAWSSELYRLRGQLLADTNPAEAKLAAHKAGDFAEARGEILRVARRANAREARARA